MFVMKQYKIIKPLTGKELLELSHILKLSFSEDVILNLPKKTQLKFKKLK